MSIKFKYILMLTCLLVSCAKQIDCPEDKTGRTLEFGISGIETQRTKSFVQTYASTLEQNGFNVLGIHSSGTLMFNTTAVKNGTYWTTQERHFYPYTGFLNVYGVYPKDVQFTDISESVCVQMNGNDCSHDIVVAEKDNVTKKSAPVILNFRHILSKALFCCKCQDDDVKFEITGMKVSSPDGGKYNLEKCRWIPEPMETFNLDILNPICDNNAFTELTDAVTFVPGMTNVTLYWKVKKDDSTIIESQSNLAVYLEEGVFTIIKIQLPKARSIADEIYFYTSVEKWDKESIDLTINVD